MGLLKDYMAEKASAASTETITIVSDGQQFDHFSTVEGLDSYEIVVVDGGYQQIDEETTVIIVGGETTTTTSEQVIIIEDQLPFPLCPGEFWAEGLRTVYGERNLVLGYTNSLEIQVSDTKTAEVGPMSSGLVLQMGKGGCQTIGTEQTFYVDMTVVDFKMSNPSGAITLEVDSNREAQRCMLVAKNTHRVLSKFAKFSQQINWPSLVAQYTSDKVAFYKEYLEMFYPATLDVYFNTTVTMNWDLAKVGGRTGKQILLNRKTINFGSDEVLTWPPAQFDFSPKEYIELLEMTSATSARIVTRIERFVSIFIFPFITDPADVLIMEERLKIGLTFEYIVSVVTKYIVDQHHSDFVLELPFPTDPAEFWKVAIQTVYGGEHQSDIFLLMGVTNALKFHFGDDSANTGSLLSGLTVKVDKVSSTNAAGSPEFSLNLKVVDFKLTTTRPGINLELDNSRGDATCVITAQQTARIIERFDQFKRRVTWKSLVDEYQQNRIRFFRKYLNFFYPADFAFTFNIKQTVNASYLDFPGFDVDRVFITRDTVVSKNTTIAKFPPSNLNITPTKQIEFVYPDAPTVVVITVDRFDLNFVTPESTDPKDLTIIYNTITASTISFEFIRKEVTKYVVTKLPFPSNPAKFWAEAIRTIYGNEFVLLGQTDSFSYKKVVGNIVKQVKTQCCFVVEVGDGVTGVTDDHENVLSIPLILKSFKMVDTDGAIELDHDFSRKHEEGTLVLRHANQVVEWFQNFYKNLDLLTLIEDFNRDPAAFYKEYIRHFYPAVIQLSLNLKKVVDGSKVGHFDGTLTLLNRETVVLISDEVLNFPPSQVELTALRPIEFVQREQPNNIIIVIENFGTRVINFHPRNEQEIIIYREIIDNGPTIQLIQQHVEILFIEVVGKEEVKLPFPVDPSQFWIEAIKTLHGTDHALLGLTEIFKFKGPDGKPINFGKLPNGLTYKITEIVPTDKQVSITFEIIDFQFVSPDGKFKVTTDKKPGQTITITVQNTTKIVEIFEQFKKPKNPTVLIQEYERDPKKFFGQYLELFFPANITLNFDVTTYYEEVIYVSKEPTIIVQEIKEFPPKDLQICPTKPIQLIGQKDPTVIVYIDTFDTKTVVPSRTVIDQIFHVDVITFDVVKYVTQVIVSQDLPFETCPGKFWKDALVSIYETDSHVLFGVTNNFEVTDSTGKKHNLGTVLSAYTIRIKDGSSCDIPDCQFVRIELEILDYKATTQHPGFEVSFDKLRPGDICTLSVKNTVEFLNDFKKVFNPKNWLNLIEQFNKGPKQFYAQFIELYTPSTLTLSYNTTYKFDKTIITIPGTEDKTLVNQDVIVITFDKVKQFPLKDVTIITREPTVLVERDNPDVVIVTVTRVETQIKYVVVDEKTDITEFNNAIIRGITIQFIWKVTNQWVTGGTGELPPPPPVDRPRSHSRSKSPPHKDKSPGRDKSPPHKDKSPGRDKSPPHKVKSPGRDKSPPHKDKSPDHKEKSPEPEEQIWGVPFSLNPGRFWSDAVRHIYGHKVLMLGSTDKFTVNDRNIGNLYTGVILEVGEGSDEDSDDLLLKFKVTDIKMIHQDDAITVVQDTQKKRPTCSIVSHNVEKVELKFQYFNDSTKWKALRDDYLHDPVAFYKKHIDVFYPASVNFSLNLKYTIDGSLVPVGFTDKKTLINREIITFTSEPILKFPPGEILFYPKGPVTLVEKENPTNTVIVIQSFVKHLVHYNPSDVHQQNATQTILIKGLTFEIVKTYVIQHIIVEWPIPELPFSLVPAKLWQDAIRTLYGEHFVYFGLIDLTKMKGPKGEVPIGPMHGGFTFKFIDVTEDLTKGFNISLQIVECKWVSEDDDTEVVLDTTKPGSIITIRVDDETKIIETIQRWKTTRQWDSLIEEYTQNKVTFYQKYIQYFYPAILEHHLVNLQFTFKGNTAKLLGFDGPVVLENKTTIHYITHIKEFPQNDIKFVRQNTIELVFPGKSDIIVTIDTYPSSIWVLPLKNNQYDIDFVLELFNTGLTFDIIHYRVINYIISKRLPFSINPGVFFSEAIKTVWGPGTLILGGSQEFHVTLPDGKIYNVGPMLNGFTVEYGEGRYEKGEDITVLLRLTDYKMTNKRGGFQIQLDNTREGNSIVLVVENSQKVIERFVQMTHATGWDALALEYKSDPKVFYRKYIQLFYPATIKATVNLKYTIDAKLTALPGFTGTKTYVNREIIHIVTKDITDFPPTNLDLSPINPVELIFPGSDTVVLTIKEFHSIWTRPVIKGDDEYIILRKLIKTGITYQYLITTVEKYISFQCLDHPLAPDTLPFPVCPGDFFAEAIRTIHGDSTLLIGSSSQLEFIDEKGNKLDDGPLLTSLLVKIVKGSCETFQGRNSIRVSFDILDFKLTTEHSKTEIEFDRIRKGTKVTLEVKNVDEIIREFAKIADITNWDKLTVEYHKSPVEFYQQYINMFFPATIKLSFNLKSVTNNVVVVNRDIIHIDSDEILTFPPSQFELHLKEPIHFVEHDHRTVVVFRINTLETHMVHLVPKGDDDINEVKQVIQVGNFTYEFVIRIVIKYLVRPPPIIPPLPFSLDPLVFWPEGIRQTVGEGDFLLSLSDDDFVVSFTDGTVTNFGPLLSGMTFKLVEATQVDTEYQLRYDIVDMKLVSLDGSLEVEQDRDVPVGQITVVTRNGLQIVEIIEKLKNAANWETVKAEYELSPKKFYEKHLVHYYPADFKINVHLKFVHSGTKTFVTKDILTYTGEISSFRHDGIKVTLQNPMILVENRQSDNVLAKIIIVKKTWITPNITDEREITQVKEIIQNNTLTYVIVREKVYKYIIGSRVPFPLCPGQFFAEAVKTISGDGHCVLGITHHYQVVVEGKTIDLEMALSAITLKIHEGASWDYTHDKSIRIRVDIRDFKLARRDGGFELEYDTTRERGNAYITVNNTTEVFKTFNDFFHPSKWDAYAAMYNQNPKAFYEKYIHVFFPASFDYSMNLKLAVDGEFLNLPGVDDRETFITKEIVNFNFPGLQKFPLGEDLMRFNVSNPIQFVRRSDVTKVIISVPKVESVYIAPEYPDKAEKAIFDQAILDGLSFRFVSDMVSRYIVTRMPFPTDIGLFWEHAIRTIYGEKHLFLGVSDKPNIAHPEAAGSKDKIEFAVGPTMSGLLTSVGSGRVTGSGANVKITCDIHLKDFKQTDYEGAVEMAYDPTRPGATGKLICLSPAKVIEQFAWMADPPNWQQLLDEYAESPKKFYKKYVKVFYPARVEIPMNVTLAVGSHKAQVENYKGGKQLISKETFTFVRESVPYWPVASTLFIPSVSVEMVDTATQKLSAYFLRKRITMVHPSKEEKSEHEICLRFYESGISFRQVTDLCKTYCEVPEFKKVTRVFVDWVEVV